MKFEVKGAGHIELSDTPDHLCGGRVGFQIKASWGGYFGGVMGRYEAIKMANYIIDKCGSVTESEQEEEARLMHQLLS